MNTALLIGGLGLALAVLGPVVRSRRNARASEREYFAAARRRAIAHRLSAVARTRKSADEE
jgi:hypothetical protein